MDKKDRHNLIHGWPVYLLFAVLIAVMVLLYRQKLIKHSNEPLSKLIAKNLQAGRSLQSIDQIINSRQSWEPTLPDWQGKTLPNLTFTLPDGQQKNLADYYGRQVVLLIGASWFPPFRLQIRELQELGEFAGDKNLTLIAAVAQPRQTAGALAMDNPGALEVVSVDFLPEPFSLPDGFPCTFFIDPQQRLKLAAVGLVPISHIRALASLSLPD
jgi:thiol-disulfide isomerase/thioredoxin